MTKRPNNGGKRPNVISNCNFTGVSFDSKACDAIQTVAEGLATNAKALGNLAEVFKSSHVNVETLLQMDTEGLVQEEKE